MGKDPAQMAAICRGPAPVAAARGWAPRGGPRPGLRASVPPRASEKEFGRLGGAKGDPSHGERTFRRECESCGAGGRDPAPRLRAGAAPEGARGCGEPRLGVRATRSRSVHPLRAPTSPRGGRPVWAQLALPPSTAPAPSRASLGLRGAGDRLADLGVRCRGGPRLLHRQHDRRAGQSRSVRQSILECHDERRDRGGGHRGRGPLHHRDPGNRLRSRWDPGSLRRPRHSTGK